MKQHKRPKMVKEKHNLTISYISMKNNIEDRQMETLSMNTLRI